MKKTIVFLTGATGTMGYAGMMEILKYPEQYELRILARPSKKNKELLGGISSQYSALSIIPFTICHFHADLTNIFSFRII